MSTTAQFRQQFIKSAGRDYEFVVRNLRRTAEYDCATYGGYRKFACMWHEKYRAQVVLRELGEPFKERMTLFKHGEAFKAWAATPGFVEEYCAKREREWRTDQARREVLRAEEDKAERRVGRLTSLVTRRVCG